ncbi:hypothetical protein GE09DRAFT_182964 [Coniochaeta sp. 2T2.1]|nr:hypothetical protein GE09DRAFT_182964 [Coniochaeta sp. 2T2.1]
MSLVFWLHASPQTLRQRGYLSPKHFPPSTMSQKRSHSRRYRVIRHRRKDVTLTAQLLSSLCGLVDSTRVSAMPPPSVVRFLGRQPSWCGSVSERRTGPQPCCFEGRDSLTSFSVRVEVRSWWIHKLKQGRAGAPHTPIPILAFIEVPFSADPLRVRPRGLSGLLFVIPSR